MVENGSSRFPFSSIDLSSKALTLQGEGNFARLALSPFPFSHVFLSLSDSSSSSFPFISLFLLSSFCHLTLFFFLLPFFSTSLDFSTSHFASISSLTLKLPSPLSLLTYLFFPLYLLSCLLVSPLLSHRQLLSLLSPFFPFSLPFSPLYSSFLSVYPIPLPCLFPVRLFFLRSPTSSLSLPFLPSFPSLSPFSSYLISLLVVSHLFPSSTFPSFPFLPLLSASNITFP